MRIARRASALVLATALLGGCGNPLGGDDDEPNIAGVSVTVGTDTVRIGPSGQSGTLSLTAGVSHPVTVRVLNAVGTDDPIVADSPGDFEIRITQDGVSRFAETGTGYPFPGTITPGAEVGPAVYRIAVYSTAHGHEEGFGFFTVTVTAAP